MKNVILLGSTGSIGKSALEVVREHLGEFRVVAMAAHSSEDAFAEQIHEFGPEAVCLADPAAAARLEKRGIKGVKFFAGSEGLREIAKWKTGEIVLAASSGVSCLIPVIEAIRAKKTVAIANKEILVIAGRIVIEEAKKSGVRILPVDSEHNAVFQCLAGADLKEIRQILLTGSGGPLKDIPASRFKGISKEVVTRHPRWNMGKKITVDSATMMNKGLEKIEAQWLFGVGPEKIKIVIHPEAVVHSMVEFIDGSILAQMGATDMKSPILHALAWPRRLADRSAIDLASIGALHFLEPDVEKFPCLGLADLVARDADSTLACALSAADEIAIDSFLNDRIDFADIPVVIEKTMKEHRVVRRPSLEEILTADTESRRLAARFSGSPVPC